jgi:hypothetical protein
MKNEVEKRLIEITATYTGKSMASFPTGARVQFMTREPLTENWRERHYAWVVEVNAENPREYTGIHQLHYKYLENVTYKYEEV